MASATFSALIPDLICVEQRGLASAIFGVMNLVGAGAGYILNGIILPLQKTSLSYPVTALLVTIFTVITLLAARETPLDPTVKLPKLGLKLGLVKMFGALKHRNFALVCIARVLYFMSLSPQAFLFFLISDISNSSNPTRDVSILSISAIVMSMVVAIPAGKLSDRIGRKIFVYATTVLFIAVYEGLLFSKSIILIWVLGGVFGAAQGCYWTVDMALAVDCFPADETTPDGDGKGEGAEAGANMGIWGVSQGVGLLVGTYCAGPILQAVGSTSESNHYTRTGYAVIFSMGSLYCLLASVAIFLIRTKPKNGTSIAQIN